MIQMARCKPAPKKTPGRSSTARKPTRCWAMRTFSTVRREVSTTNAVSSRAPWENCGLIVVRPINRQQARQTVSRFKSRIDVQQQPLSSLSFPFLRFFSSNFVFWAFPSDLFYVQLIICSSQVTCILQNDVHLFHQRPAQSTIPSDMFHHFIRWILFAEIWLSFRHVVENVRLSIFVLWSVMMWSLVPNLPICLVTRLLEFFKKKTLVSIVGQTTKGQTIK